MPQDPFLTILYFVVMALLTILGYGVKTFMFDRLSKLEDKMDNTATKQELTEALETRIDPLKESVQEVKDTVDKLYNILLKKND